MTRRDQVLDGGKAHGNGKSEKSDLLHPKPGAIPLRGANESRELGGLLGNGRDEQRLGGRAMQRRHPVDGKHLHQRQL